MNAILVQQQRFKMVQVKQVDCHEVEQVHAIIQSIETTGDSNGKLYVLFTGSKDPQTGKSWCPDCVRGEPLIFDGLNQVDDDVTVVVVHVVREEYRSPDYILRRDPRINLRCVPTLMKWEKGEAVMRLNDVQCQNIHAIAEFLSLS